MNQLTVVIADDHPVFLEALRQLVAKLGVGATTIEVESFQALQKKFEEIPHVDLVLLDLDMPGAHGFSALTYLRYHHPQTRVAIVSGHEDAEVVQRAFALGAAAYITKSLPLKTLVMALRAALKGDTWGPPVSQPTAAGEEEQGIAKRVAGLSPQQMRVLMGLAEGRLNKQIASELGITEGTVKGHVTSLLRHLGLKRRTEAAVLAQRILNTRPGALGKRPLEATAEERR